MSGDTLVLTTRKGLLPSDGWGSGMILNALQWTGMTLKTENYLSTVLWLKNCSRLWHNEKSAASLGEPRLPVNREASPHSRIYSPQFMDVRHMEVIFGHSSMLINIFFILTYCFCLVFASPSFPVPDKFLAQWESSLISQTNLMNSFPVPYLVFVYCHGTLFP